LLGSPNSAAAEASDQGGVDESATPATVSHEILGRDLRIAALEARMLRYETAIENVLHGVCFFDGDERLILCNRRYAEMYRLRPEQLRPGAPLSEILRLRSATRTSAIIGADDYLACARAIIASASSRIWTATLRDGRTIRICHQPMSDGGWVATHEDVTELTATRAVENDLISLQALIDGVPDYLWVKDTQSRFVVANRAIASDNARASTNDMIGLNDFDLHASEAAFEFRAVEENIIRTGQPMIDREESIVNASGDRKWLLSTKMPLRNERNEIFGLLGISRDISERVRVQTELRRAQEFLNLVIESMPEAILVKDLLSRRFTLANHGAEQFLEMPRADIIGKRAHEVYPAEFAAEIAKRDEELLQAGELFVDEYRFEKPGRNPRLVRLHRKVVKGESGEPQHLLTIIEDITERKRAEERIIHLAHHDPLTDLPNRARFNEQIAAVLTKAAGSMDRFAVLCIDLDHLKEVNDVFGHAAGDQMLCEIARRLLDAAGGAFVARLGGDEFVVIAETTDLPTPLSELTDRLLDTAHRDLDVDGVSIRAGISIGVAVFPENGRDATTLLANADAALYRAKAEGRGIARFFKADMDKRQRERHALRHDLDLAIERDELTMFYQPQATMTREVVGFEALMRWRHPLFGSIPPATFIPIAEESRLIIRLGEWALRDVCREAASWPRPLSVAVNLSPVQFHHVDLPQLVHSILLETGLAANRLELEITEGVLIADSPRALSMLRRLKALGVRIVMDDFGKGYSSLSYLQSFPFDKIKIDRAFVTKVAQNPHAGTIVRAVLGLARGLKLPVLAEGVETEEVFAFLADEACDQVQGYLIGRPLSIASYARLIGRPSRTPLSRRSIPRRCL
jgi:diguanylate cyclase (GGDEF)-like protein/PAS domain S-box-containing protein